MGTDARQGAAGLDCNICIAGNRGAVAFGWENDTSFREHCLHHPRSQILSCILYPVCVFCAPGLGLEEGEENIPGELHMFSVRFRAAGNGPGLGNMACIAVLASWRTCLSQKLFYGLFFTLP